MTKKEFKVSYIEYNSIGELESKDAELVREAIEARRGSFSPYSHFKVGAAVRLESGVIVKGANQENSAFPSGLCAERTTMFYAASNYPNDPIRSIAIAGGLEDGLAENPVSPCGACRQVMAQYQKNGGQPMTVILVGSKRIWKFHDVDSILPFIFDDI